MGNKDNMKRKTSRKGRFCGRSSAVNDDAGKERNEDAESGQPNLGFDLPEVDGSGPTAKKLKLDDALQEADETNMSKENGQVENTELSETSEMLEMSEKMSEKISEMSEKISGKISEMSEKISEKISEMSEKISEMSEKISEEISEMS